MTSGQWVRVVRGEYCHWRDSKIFTKYGYLAPTLGFPPKSLYSYIAAIDKSFHDSEFLILDFRDSRVLKALSRI